MISVLPKRPPPKHGNQKCDQDPTNKRLNAREHLRRCRDRLNATVAERREGDGAKVDVPDKVGLLTADHDPTDERVDRREDGHDHDRGADDASRALAVEHHPSVRGVLEPLRVRARHESSLSARVLLPYIGFRDIPGTTVLALEALADTVHTGRFIQSIADFSPFPLIEVTIASESRD